MNLESKRLSIVKTIASNNLLDKRKTDKYFGKVPLNVKLLVRDFNFDSRSVLDIGCSYGNSLLYWGKNSEGIELNKEARSFISSFNINTHICNVENGFDFLNAKFSTVYTNNLIEHLLSPHLFLTRIHKVLQSDGILAIGHPAIPPRIIEIIYNFMGLNGWIAPEHINFYNSKIIYHMLERAGFKVIIQYNKPQTLLRLEKLSVLHNIFSFATLNVLTVCRKLNNFKYPDERLNMFDPDWAIQRKNKDFC